MSEFREVTSPDLWQVEVRYLMTDLMIRHPRKIWRVSEFVEALDDLGVDLGQRYGIRPAKRLSDLLRTEMVRGRVVRVGWGRYRLGVIPDTTRRRILARARSCRDHLCRMDRQ